MFDGISAAMGLFDTDEMDIYRRGIEVDADGDEKETEPILIYSAAKCHVSFRQIDNPNPNTFGTTPTVTILRVDFAKGIDLRKNDHVVIRRLDSNGAVLGVYEGNASMPEAYQSRQKAQILMQEDV